MNLRNINSLENPDTVPPKEFGYSLSKFYPFYNDFYFVIELKNLNFFSKSYAPIFIAEKELAENYYDLTDFQIVFMKEKILSPIKKINIYLLQNPSSKLEWCVYIVKTFIWKMFTYTGITTIFCDDKQILVMYIEKNFAKILNKNVIY